MALYTTIKDIKVKVGDDVSVTTQYIDAGKTKKQVFKGVIIAIKNEGVNKSFTVRKMTSSGIGIERIFPVQWPFLEKIAVNSHNPVRRAKLYYMRERVGKRAMKT